MAEKQTGSCGNCAHSRKRETEHPCAECIHDEYVEKLPAYGKWTAPGPKEENP